MAMNWRRRTTMVLAAAVLGGLMTSGTAEAAASEDVCGSTGTPAGWIEVKYWDSSSCGVTGGGMYNTKRITDTGDVAAGGTVNACTYSPVPDGFYNTKYSSVSDCDRSNAPSDYHNRVALVRLAGLPAGTTKTICGLIEVPAGWSVVSRSRTIDCEQYKFGLPANDNTMTIRKS